MTRQPYVLVCIECGYERQRNPDALMAAEVPVHCDKIMLEKSRLEYMRSLSTDGTIDLRIYTEEGYQQWMSEREVQP